MKTGREKRALPFDKEAEAVGGAHGRDRTVSDQTHETKKASQRAAEEAGGSRSQRLIRSMLQRPPICTTTLYDPLLLSRGSAACKRFPRVSLGLRGAAITGLAWRCLTLARCGAVA